MGVGSKDSVPAGFPKKNSGPTPEGLSIRTGTGVGHPPLWCPTMALKIKIPGEPVGHPGASFPVPTRLASGKCGSICEGRGRLRMISTAFDPVFSTPRKEVAGRPDPFLHGVLEFVRGGKSGQKRPRGSPGPQMVSRFSFRKTGVAVFS